MKGRQVVPVEKRRGATGRDVSSLDPQMLEQIEQTSLDRAGRVSVAIFAPLP